MTRKLGLAVLIALTASLVVLAAVPAQAAKRKVPFGFFGTVLPPEMARPEQVSDAALEQQMALMASSGVESLRVTLAWPDLEPTSGAYDFAVFDRVLAAAARHGIAVLVNVTQTAPWASERPNDAEAWRLPPRDPNTFAELMRQLVLRYGPTGSFWAQNPSLPGVPIRQWQIWNEQTAPWHWRRQPWAPSYTRLLEAAYRSIHAADRGAQVVAGSLVASRADYAPWDAARDLYRAGAKPFFDVVAVHPFTNNSGSARLTVDQTLEIVQRVRAQMRRRRDGRKPIILTELTWPASVGKVPRGALLGLETTSRGQVARLKAGYRRLARDRRKLGITEAYWYNWASQYDADGALSVMSFRYAGLTRIQGGVFSPMPILRTYANLARTYQGCRKSSNARRCG
jgi:polysaccharide biosynthesis protein PslG